MVHEEAKIEYFHELVEELKEANAGTPIVVEGERDVESMRTLGISGEIIVLNQGVSLFVFCELLAEKYSDVILLTDWDRKGNELHDKLVKNLEANVVGYNDKFWHKFKGFTGKNISCVEELHSFYLWLMGEK